MVFLVAEIGVNWEGDFDLAKNMMIAAKKSGCDAVKFQAFNKEIIKEHPLASHLIKCAISESNIETINDLSKSIGIEWFCTPMYVEAVDMLNPYVKRFKIRFSDGKLLLEDKISNLVNKALETDKEVIISSEKSPLNTKYYDHPLIKWLYCVPKYPCSFTDLDFRKLKELDGYSNHCPHILAPLTAVALGANIIEVHVTYDKSKNYVDNNVSFDFQELNQLSQNIRLLEKIIR